MPLTSADVAGLRLKHIEIIQQNIRFFTGCRHLLLGVLVVSLLLTGLYGRLGSVLAIFISILTTYFDYVLYTRLAAAKSNYTKSIADGLEAIPDFSLASLDWAASVKFSDYVNTTGGACVVLSLISIASLFIRLGPAPF